mgnify:CR=1 FL=1
MHRAGKRVGTPVAAVAVVLTAVLLLGAWQWPVPDVRIEVSFGQPLAAGVSPGLRLVSDSDRVAPAEEGEVVFATEPDGGSRSIPHGLGNFVVLEHEGGFRSLYAHLEDRGSLPAIAGTDTDLGGVGQTGFSPGNTLGFRIIDTERDAYVNPLLLLPELEDGTGPRIENVELLRSERTIWPPAGQDQGQLAAGTAIEAGPAELRARVYDPATDGPYRSSASPYSVTVFVNGQESFEVALETLSREAGRLVFSSSTPSGTLYAPDGRLRLGRAELTPGANLVEIVARDVAGNERVMTFEIQVQSAQQVQGAQ